MKICLSCTHQFEQKNWQCPNCGWSPKNHSGHYLLREHGEDGTIEGYRDEYFAPLAEVEKGHFWFEARNRILLWALRRFFPDISSLLEIGCGTGFVLSAIRGAFPAVELSGAEYYARGLSFAASRVPTATFYQMDARSMPFEAEFDIIGAFDVIEHIKEDEHVLSEMFRAVKPGGGIVLTVPQHPSLWSVADVYKHHERRYARDELVEEVERAGFRTVYTTSFVTFLLPLMLLSRLKQDKAEGTPDRLTELKINRLANTILSNIMRTEVFFIHREVSFPVGGSMLLVARKD